MKSEVYLSHRNAERFRPGKQSEGNEIMDLQDYILVGFAVLVFIGASALALIAAATVIVASFN